MADSATIAGAESCDRDHMDDSDEYIYLLFGFFSFPSPEQERD